MIRITHLTFLNIFCIISGLTCANISQAVASKDLDRKCNLLLKGLFPKQSALDFEIPTKKQIDAFQKNNRQALLTVEPVQLSNDDSWALKQYADSAYFDINWALRESETGIPIEKEMGKQIYTLESALNKLTSFQGEVFRGTTLNADQANPFLQVGNVIKEPSFLSTDLAIENALSLQAAKTEGMGQSIPLLFVIKSKNGKYIKPYVKNPFTYEQEVLFKRGSMFKIAEKRFKDNMWLIYLIEL